MPDEIAVEQFLAVVGGDDHDGIGVQSGGDQRTAQTSEKLAVEPADLRVVERLDPSAIARSEVDIAARDHHIFLDNLDLLARNKAL